MDNGVPKYFLLNHNSAESRTLPDSTIIPISEILDTAILLNKIFPNSELAGKKNQKLIKMIRELNFRIEKWLGFFYRGETKK